MIRLPEKFLARMALEIPDEEYRDFLASYDNVPRQGLRVNPLKISTNDFLNLVPFKLVSVPWCPTGFYYGEGDRPGKHPYHATGLYYIQEPSAMAVVEALQPLPGDRVLDLCAAPGGKSTQIAGVLNGQGLLVANEIHPKRAKVLSENLERWGATNILVTNETPERLAERFREFFDKIVLDAPCSGEGMFRKLEEAVTDWSEAKVEQCALMQKDILDQAARMLRSGGTMVYSTCTFSRQENENQIADFLERNPGFALQHVELEDLFAAGNIKKTVRLWPHKIEGEGHFLAILKKENSLAREKARLNREKGAPPIPADALQLFKQFCVESLNFVPEGRYILFGEQLYIIPEPVGELSGLKVQRAGWQLGAVKKGRFEPAHSLALSLRNGQWRKQVDFSAEGPEVIRYLKGETIMVSEQNAGWNIITVGGFPLGWGKIAGSQLKNHYPKGLRWM